MALPNNKICCANAGLKLDALYCTAGDVTGPCRQLAGMIRSHEPPVNTSIDFLSAEG